MCEELGLNVLMCINCECALEPKGVFNHLHNKDNLPTNRRQDVEKLLELIELMLFDSIELLLGNLSNLNVFTIMKE